MEIKLCRKTSDRKPLMPDFLKKKYLHVPELELVRKTGETAIINAWFSIMQIEDKDSSKAVFSDLTSLKKAERKVLKYQTRRKALASELMLMEEKQRKQIATDLHDYVGQLQALSTLQLAAIHEGMAIKKVIEKLIVPLNLS